MGASPHIQRLRAAVGHELLLLPAVSVLTVDDVGRLLLVQHADGGRWGLVGGAIDPGEAPSAAAVREAREETGLDVELTGLLAALGGAEFRVTYANGDVAEYVSVVYRARVVGGTLRADGVEAVDCAWFRVDDLSSVALGGFAAATLQSVGWLAG